MVDAAGLLQLLCGDQLPEVLSYYSERAFAGMIYPHYSDWKAGDMVQKTGKGEKLDLDLLATEPFSPEGIPMKDRPLLRRGVLKTIFGTNRFCRYLGVEPTKPGFAAYRVKPSLGGLKWMEGDVPTPSGSIHVRMDATSVEVTGNGGEGELVLPDGRTTRIRPREKMRVER